jgi:hypothetical protein
MGWSDPVALRRKWLLQTGLQLCSIYPRQISCKPASLSGEASLCLAHHRALPRLSSVTESIALPPRPKRRSRCQISANSAFASGSCPRYCCRSFLCCWPPLRCLFSGSPPRRTPATSSGKQLVRSDETNSIFVSLADELNIRGRWPPWMELARCRWEMGARRRCTQESFEMPLKCARVDYGH